MKKSSILTVAASAVMLNFASMAQAAVILPGQSVQSPSLVQEGTLGAANFNSVAFTPFSTGTASGMFREFVSQGRTGNPFSGLSFEYQFTVTSGSVQAFTASGFEGWQTNVTFAPGGTVPASAASRSANGDLINFTLAGQGVQAGQTSMWLIVDTNAPGNIGNTIQFRSGDFSSPNLEALGPAVPEPGTLVLLGIGAMGMAGYGWRGRKSAKAIA